MRHAQQTVDVRALAISLRRRWRVLVIAALLGAVCGLGFGLARPAPYTSDTWVLLPSIGNASGQAPARSVETQVELARSAAVLDTAGRTLAPALSAEDLRLGHVSVQALSDDVLQIWGIAETPELAESIASRVASADVEFLNGQLNSLTDAQRAAIDLRIQTLQTTLGALNTELSQARARLVGSDPASAASRGDAAAVAQLTAQQTDLVLRIDDLQKQRAAAAGATAQVRGTVAAAVVQSASRATRPSLVPRLALLALGGALLMLLLGAAVAIQRSRSDGRLVLRDEIAEAVGSPVIASITRQVPDTVASWSQMFAAPIVDDVDNWRLRQSVHRLRDLGAVADRVAPGVGGVVVVTLGGDTEALVVAPLLASHMAASGSYAALGFVQRHEGAAALWTACHHAEEDGVQPNLRVGVGAPSSDASVFAVLLAVVDPENPQLTSPLPATSPLTLLAISAGFATAPQLARLALRIADAGRRIDGVFVTAPDSLDRGTGSLIAQASIRELTPEVALR